MKVHSKVSILVPVYNMEKKIKDNIEYLIRSVESFISNFEIILSDDGSSDNTLEELKQLEETHGNIIVLSSDRNYGKGNALKRACEKARGEYIVFCDADMEIAPSQIEIFFDIMEMENADVVIGSKRHKDSKVNYSNIRKLISFVYFLFIKIFFRLKINDTQTGLKLFKRDAIVNVFPRVLVKAFAYDLEVLVACNVNGKKIVSAPVTINPNRNFGGIPFRVLYATFIDTIAIFYRLNFLKFYYNLFDERKNEHFVSIIIPLKKINDYILESANAVLKQTYQNFELIILPDSYTEDEITDKVFSNSKVILKSTGNLLPAKKRDMGVEISKGNILAFIDDDTFPEVNWLCNALRAIDTYNIKSLGGPAVNTDSDSFFQQISGIIYASKLMSWKYSFRYIYKKVQYVDDYPSCNFFVTRELYDLSGGFNSKSKLGEDTILCNNILKLGEKILYTPEAVVYHHRRNFFMGHYKQIKGWAWHRGHFARIVGGNSRNISYLIPSIYTAYLFLFIPLFVSIYIYRNAFPIDYKYLLTLISLPNILYVFLLIFSGIATLSIPKGFFKILGIFLSHITYGIYFLAGFLNNKNRDIY